MLKAAYLQSEDWSFAAFLHKLNSALTKEEASESKESGGASIFSLLV